MGFFFFLFLSFSSLRCCFFFSPASSAFSPPKDGAHGPLPSPSPQRDTGLLLETPLFFHSPPLIEPAPRSPLFLFCFLIIWRLLRTGFKKLGQGALPASDGRRSELIFVCAGLSLQSYWPLPFFHARRTPFPPPSPLIAGPRPPRLINTPHSEAPTKFFPFSGFRTHLFHFPFSFPRFKRLPSFSFSQMAPDKRTR